MNVALTISDSLLKEAQYQSGITRRTVESQIEYWASIGRLAEANQDLPYSFIKDILLAKEQVKTGDISEYTFG